MIPPVVRGALLGWLVASPWAFALNPPLWVSLFMSPSPDLDEATVEPGPQRSAGSLGRDRPAA